MNYFGFSSIGTSREKKYGILLRSVWRLKYLLIFIKKCMKDDKFSSFIRKHIWIENFGSFYRKEHHYKRTRSDMTRPM